MRTWDVNGLLGRLNGAGGTKPRDPEDRPETSESEEQRLEAQQPKGHPA